MGVKYSDLPRTNTVHMDDRVAVLSSTDDILKTVPAGSLGGVFVGTSAQWAALTAEQKAQYDQKQVILTDGEGGGFNPVEITYADWIALPPAQRNSGTWLVTGFPVATNADLIPYTGDVQAANVGAAINALNQNLTTRYNPTTDRFEVLYNGNWVQSIRAWIQSVDIYDNGVFKYPYQNGITFTNSPSTNDGGWSVENDRLGVVNVINNHYRAIAFDEPIDFTNYSKITVTTDRGSFEVNVEHLTQTAYICLHRSNGAISCRVNEIINVSAPIAEAYLPNPNSATTYVYKVVLE